MPLFFFALRILCFFYRIVLRFLGRHLCLFACFFLFAVFFFFLPILITPTSHMTSSFSFFLPLPHIW